MSGLHQPNSPLHFCLFSSTGSSKHEAAQWDTSVTQLNQFHQKKKKQTDLIYCVTPWLPA